LIQVHGADYQAKAALARYRWPGGGLKITVGGQVTGNRETAPTECRGGEISGGTDYSLARGDVLFIPAGLPHKVLVSPKSSITYMTVKTPK
jgi:hypothetical protein